ncbi:hypothetical protein GGR58DRAFT_519948 [Xylaria digitata]|nr:hypothetical protein GGR58DRAFT_519948 [Xylaria digitata]
MAYNWQGVHFEDTPYHGGTGKREEYKAAEVLEAYITTGSYTTTGATGQYSPPRVTTGYSASGIAEGYEDIGAIATIGSYTATGATGEYGATMGPYATMGVIGGYPTVGTTTMSYNTMGTAGGFPATGPGAYTCTGAIGGYGDTGPIDQTQEYGLPYLVEDHVFEHEQKTDPEFWNGPVAERTLNYVQRGRPTERGEVCSTRAGDAELDREREANIQDEEMRARRGDMSYGDGDPGPPGTQHQQPREQSRRRHHSLERREHHKSRSKGKDKDYHKSDKHRHESGKHDGHHKNHRRHDSSERGRRRGH